MIFYFQEILLSVVRRNHVFPKRAISWEAAKPWKVFHQLCLLVSLNGLVLIYEKYLQELSLEKIFWLILFLRKRRKFLYLISMIFIWASDKLDLIFCSQKSWKPVGLIPFIWQIKVDFCSQKSSKPVWLMLFILWIGVDISFMFPKELKTCLADNLYLGIW